MAVCKIKKVDIDSLTTAQSVTVTPVTNTSSDYYINISGSTTEIFVNRVGQIVTVSAVVRVHNAQTANFEIVSSGIPKPVANVAFFVEGDPTLATSSIIPLRVFIGSASSQAGKMYVRAGSRKTQQSESSTTTVDGTYLVYVSYITQE